MTTAEAKRHGLYNVLTEVIGAEETDTLMTYLPNQPNEMLATKADLDSLRDEIDVRFNAMDARFDANDRRFDAMDARFASLDGRIDGVNRRLDRLFLTLAAGLLAIVGTMLIQTIL